MAEPTRRRAAATLLRFERIAAITPLFPRIGFDLRSPWLSYARIFGASLAVATCVGAVVFLFVELPVMRLRPRPPGAAAGPAEAR